MDKYKGNNYTLIEILHLSYVIRDSLEYCNDQIKVPEDAFEKRKNMSQAILKEGNFIEKWFNSQPKDEIKDLYKQLVNYFNDLYVDNIYLNADTKKIEEDKRPEFIENTIKLYQVAEDVLTAFYNEYKKTPEVINPDIEKCIFASKDFYRVICNWIFFNEILRNDNQYKKALKESGNKPSYEVNFNLNVLKRLVAGYNFNKQKYNGDKVDIKEMFESSMQAFKALDGSLQKEYKDAHDGNAMPAEEVAKSVQEIINKAVQQCVGAIKLYEPIWRETYNKVIAYMKEQEAEAATTASAQA